MATQHRCGRTALAIGLTVALAACDWTGFGFDAAHTRATADAGPPMLRPRLLTHVWTGRTGAPVTSSPVTAGDTVFVTTTTGKLLAFAATMTAENADCEWTAFCGPRWSADLGAASTSTPTVDRGTVFAAADDGVVRAFDAAGEQGCTDVPRVCTARFRTVPVGAVESALQVVGDTLLVGSTDGNLYAFDARGTRTCSASVCAPLWRAPTGGPIRSSPAVSDGRVFVGSDSGRLAAFDLTGTTECSAGVCRPLWTGTAGGPVRSSPAIAAGTVVVGADDGVVRAFDAAGSDGCAGVPRVCTPRWSASTGGAVTAAPAIADGRVVVGSDDGSLRAFDLAGTTGCGGTPRTCSPLWRAPMDGAVRGSPAVAGHVVYAAAAGEVAAYDLAGARSCAGAPRQCLPLWAAPVPAPASAPTVSRAQVLVGAGDLHVFRVVIAAEADELRATTLTAERADTFELTLADDRALLHAPATNGGGNTRVTFTRDGDATGADQYSCATWASDTDWHDQEGAALRVRLVSGGVRAITVTKNVFFGANWKFNVHVWDTSRSPAAIQIGAFDLGPVFSPDEIHVAPLPWKLCAQAVGATVSFVVWPASHARPAWGDPAYGGSVTLPSGWSAPGDAGWYIGHLEPDHRAEFTDLDTGPAPAPGSASGGSSDIRTPRTAPRAPTAILALP